MPDWDDVRRLALALPGAEERVRGSGELQWRVRQVLFAWERPLRAGDRAALGAAAPDGPILGVRVPDLGAKQAVLATGAPACFTIAHFDNYPAVLVQLDLVDAGELEELITEAWLCRAPKRVVSQYLSEH